ncbi:hypothetical protein PSH66_29805 [Pseudomonas sp. FP597]|uniref:hypothetical protein n=1 Tax=Pseudomonas sp. FP597 TaxID=2954096 RepID=UPI0027336B0C|nr:hypothetical protein [Pseudomonas sp. FP597]WLI06715.1 hypothetical protein PSH66_29805 [Pseudomonas sp. FP597]
MKIIRTLFVVMGVCTISLSGCVNKRASNWHDFTVLEDLHSENLTEPIVLVADTQFHESRGTASHYFSMAGDEFFPVTIRTGQQVIGAPDLLLRALDQGQSYPLALHLGDGIDVSCQTEWSLFKQVMGEARGRPSASSWLFSPGNHDGFMVGNIYPKTDGIYKTEYWNNVCNVGRGYAGSKQRFGRMPKETIVNDYVNLLRGQPLSQKNPASGQFCLDGNQLCVAYRIASEPWKSFIVQLVKLPPSRNNSRGVYALLLDTSDYPSRPNFGMGGPTAGIDAGISVDQIKAAQQLVSSLPDNSRYFFTGHHSFKDWKVESWKGEKLYRFVALSMGKQSLRFVVTAHTHEGGWYEHDFGGGHLQELNTGSLADAPLYYRDLSFQLYDGGAVSVRSNRILLDSVHSKCNEYKPPADGSGYSVNDQQTESDRLSAAPAFLRRIGSFFSAAGHFFAFWEAKHSELKPQLLAYADIVQDVIPDNQAFNYHPYGTNYELPFRGGSSIAEHLRYLAGCFDAKKCSVSQKGNLLYSLDRYFWFSKIPVEQKQLSHNKRYCAAIVITGLAGDGSPTVEQSLQDSQPSVKRLAVRVSE